MIAKRHCIKQTHPLYTDFFFEFQWLGVDYYNSVSLGDTRKQPVVPAENMEKRLDGRSCVKYARAHCVVDHGGQMSYQHFYRY